MVFFNDKKDPCTDFQSEICKNPSQPTDTYVTFVVEEQGGGEIEELPLPEHIPCYGLACRQKKGSTFPEGENVAIATDGSGSDVKLLVAFTHENSDKFFMHFGVALVQMDAKGSWLLEQGAEQRCGSCLLLHHIGHGICVEVASDLEAAKIAMQVFRGRGLQMVDYDIGSSRADLEYFLGAFVLNKHLKRKYSNAYTREDGRFYEWGETNCLRLALDVLLSLKAPPELARAALGLDRDDFGARSEGEALKILLANTIIFLRNNTCLCELQKVLPVYEDLKKQPNKKVSERFVGQLDKTLHLHVVLGVLKQACEDAGFREVILKHLAELNDDASMDSISLPGIVTAIVAAYCRHFGNIYGMRLVLPALTREALTAASEFIGFP